MKQFITLLRDFGSDLMSQVGGAVTGAVGGIMGLPMAGISNLMQQGNQQALTNQQVAATEQLQQNSENLQYDLWQKTNYPAQVQQLNQAGLNPALLYAKGGPGGTTGAPTGAAGMGIAPGGQAAQATQSTQQQLALGLEQQQTAADVKLKEAQAENLAADTTKKTGVDTQAVQATIDNMKQLTQNAQVQNGILQWEQGIKAAEATVATKTIDVSIKSLTTQYETLQQHLRSATIGADLSAATKDQLIQQARNATIQQGLDIILTKAQTAGIIQNIAESKNAIQMAVQKNMREWDTMPNVSVEHMSQMLENDLKLMQQLPNVGEELLQSISHLVIPLATKTPAAPGGILNQINTGRSAPPAGGRY